MKCIKNIYIYIWVKTIHYPNKIRSHLVTIASMAPFTPKSTSKLRSALHFSYSQVIPRFTPALIRLNPNNHSNHVFITLLTTTTLLIVTHYCAQWLLVLTLYANEYLWYYCNYENKSPI